MIRVIVLIAIMVSMCACNASLGVKGQDGKDGEPGKPGTSGNLGVDFKVLAKGDQNGRDEESHVIVRNAEELRNATENMKIDGMPGTDFGTKMLVVIFMGQKNTGGYSIDVENVMVKGETLIINTIKKSPSGMATMGLTNPYCIVEVPKASNVYIQ